MQNSEIRIIEVTCERMTVFLASCGKSICWDFCHFTEFCHWAQARFRKAIQEKNWAVHQQSWLSSWHTGNSTDSITSQPKKMHLKIFFPNISISRLFFIFLNLEKQWKKKRKKKKIHILHQNKTSDLEVIISVKTTLCNKWTYLNIPQNMSRELICMSVMYYGLDIPC